MLLKYLKNKETIAFVYCCGCIHGNNTMTIIFIGALSFLAFVVQSIVAAGNNSGDASWLLSMGE